MEKTFKTLLKGRKGWQKEKKNTGCSWVERVKI